MSKAIWKYPLAVESRQVISMPVGAQILSVQVQGGTPCLWALVEIGAPPRDRGIQVFGTGHPADDAGVFIGTFQLSGGMLVFHVFEDRDNAHPALSI